MAGTRGTYLPLAALLLATTVTLLVATSAIPVAAAVSANKYSGRMVIIRAPGARVGALSKWQQRRLVEDEVTPDFSGGLLGGDPGIGYGALDPNKHVCVAKCALPGQRYTPGHCTYENHCPQGPNAAEHAGTMHA